MHLRRQPAQPRAHANECAKALSMMVNTTSLDGVTEPFSGTFNSKRVVCRFKFEHDAFLRVGVWFESCQYTFCESSLAVLHPPRLPSLAVLAHSVCTPSVLAGQTQVHTSLFGEQAAGYEANYHLGIRFSAVLQKRRTLSFFHDVRREGKHVVELYNTVQHSAVYSNLSASVPDQPCSEGRASFQPASQRSEKINKAFVCEHESVVIPISARVFFCPHNCVCACVSVSYTDLFAHDFLVVHSHWVGASAVC